MHRAEGAHLHGKELPLVSAFQCKYHLTSDIIGHGHLAAPAVAGLAAYLMSLDQYRVQLLVPGSVARNVRDLIKSLAYARLPDQPVVLWNGIDSREIYCPVRRDAGSSGCPARNATSPISPPVQTKTPGSRPNPVIPGQSPKVTATSSSNSPLPSNAAGSLTITVHSSSDSFSLMIDPSATTTATVTLASGSNSLPSDSSISFNDPYTYTLTISLSGSTATTVTFTDG